MRLEFDGAMATSILPTGDFGNPGCASRSQVVPPSFDRYTPLPGPPLNIAQVCITTSQVPASRRSGLLGSIDMPEQPVSGFTKSTRCQFFPPSIVRYTPRSCCGPVVRPSAQANTMSGLVGWTSMRPMRPVSSRPMCVHVLPASADL